MHPLRLPVRHLAGIAALAVALPTVAGTVRLEATRFGEPIPEPTRAKFYVHEPGERDGYVGWGHLGKGASVPDGTYDVVAVYENDLARSRRTFEGVTVAGERVLRVDFEVGEAVLQIDVTRGGEPAPRFAAQYGIHEAGKRGTPLASRRPGTPTTLRPGRYDIEVTLRDGRGLKRQWLEGFVLEGDRLEVVEMGLPPTRLTVRLLDDGRELADGEGGFAVFRRGESRRPLREGRSGASVGLDDGLYDVALYDGPPGVGRPARWVRDLEVRGEVRRALELRPQAATQLTVTISPPGERPGDAWFQVYRIGERRRPVRSGLAGDTVQIEEGLYDIAAFVRDRGVVGERWLPGRRVAGPTSLAVDLRIEPATLRIDPPRGLDRGPRELLVVLDSSEAMGERLEDDSRLNAARRALVEAVGAARLDREGVAVGLRAYGVAPIRQRDCRDSARLLDAGPVDTRRLGRSLDLLRPGGFSPLADTLGQLAEDANPAAYTSVVVLTGSRENCAGDPCAEAARLLRDGRVDAIRVIGVGVDPADWVELHCVGTFTPADSDATLAAALREAVRDAADADGSVSVFRPGGREWVATARLGETIPIAAGRYDLRIRAGEAFWSWDGVEIEGRFRARAAASP